MNIRTFKLLLFISLPLLLLFLLLSHRSGYFPDMRCVCINGENYFIPKKNLSMVSNESSLFFSWLLGSNGGYDPETSLVAGLRWTPEEMVNAIPEFSLKNGKMLNFVHVGIHAPVETAFSGLSADALQLSGRFSDARVEYDDTLKLYKVTPKIDWCAYYLKMKPGKNVEVPKLISTSWEGTVCNSFGNVSSKVGYYENKIYFDIDIGGENFHLRDKIVRFVVAQFNSWKKCGD